jgi:hypothetical protein
MHGDDLAMPNEALATAPLCMIGIGSAEPGNSEGLQRTVVRTVTNQYYWGGKILAEAISLQNVGVSPTWVCWLTHGTGKGFVSMQRDYILRMIEQAGFVLKQLLQRIQAEPVSHAERTEALARAAQLGGLDLDMLRLSDVKGLWHQVALTGEADPARTWLAAETLYADALANEIEGNTEAAVETYVKAASLFRLMQPTWVLPTGFPEAMERVEEIDGKLEILSE